MSRRFPQSPKRRLIQLAQAAAFALLLAPAAVSAQDEAASGAAPKASDDLYAWVASHCFVDELARTPYARGWLEWVQHWRFLPEGAPRPSNYGVPIPAAGTPKAAARAQALRDAWRKDPKSHVVDCKMAVPDRSCETCTGGAAKVVRFAAYLPKALVVEPGRVRSVLMLVPGGNGGRTRYFLTPIPQKTLHDKMSGGLETKRLVDEYLDAHPDAVPPIVVALDSAGFLTVNGATEFLTHDMPEHVASVFLDRPRSEIAVGVEGISSGARAMMDALRAKPESFNSVGLTCMHCRRYGGIDPDKHLGTKEERARWVRKLGDLARQQRLHIRFSVGNEDNQWGCNKEFHDLFVEGGVLESTEPSFGRCRATSKAASPETCDTEWDGFLLFDGIAHHYGLLLPSFEPQLGWHIAALSESVAALDSK